jgi:hypothetical protein
MVTSPNTITLTTLTAGAHTLYIEATDGTFGVWSNMLTIDIPAYIPTPPVITPGVLPGGMIGAAYSAFITATNTPTSWAVTSGALPAGLTLNATTGEIAGTPTAAGTFNFDITATNADGTSPPVSFSITIGGSYAVSVTTPAIASGGAYSFGNATDGYAAITPISFTVSNTGTLAVSGLTVALSGAGASAFTLDATGFLATLAVGGTTSFTLQPNTGLSPGTYSATATINGSGIPAYTFTVGFTVLSPPLAYYTVTVNGGVGSGTYYEGEIVTIKADPAPADKFFWQWNMPYVTFVYGTGEPSETAIFIMPSFNVIATAVYLDLPPSITTLNGTLPEGKTGEAYTATLSATGGGTITWSISGGSLPPGLTLTSAGVITGTPTTAGVYNFSVKATNSTGSDFRTLTITIILDTGNETVGERLFTASPNPTTGKLTVKGYDPSMGNLYLIDAAGRITAVYNPAITDSGDTFVINISHLPAGIYYLKAGDKVMKIIKN